MSRETKYLLVVFLAGVLGGVIFFIKGKEYLRLKKEEKGQKIINCLIKNKAILYISSDCDFCGKQEEIFGENLNKIKVINCGEARNWDISCRRNKINSVPAWVFSVNKKFSKINLSSCSDCQRKSNQIYYEDYCYIKLGNKDLIKISGFLDFDKINEIFKCYEK